MTYNPQRPWERGTSRRKGVNPLTVVWVAVLATVVVVATLGAMVGGCLKVTHDVLKETEIGPPAKAAPNAKR